MAATSSAEPSSLEVLPWLKTVPLAPEYHPTLAEFQDPIAYILKIEKEASSYGICKIVPPLPSAPKKTAIANLNRSFAARDPNPKKPPTFTTRQQQIGFCPRRPRPAQKPVWQSGEQYTLQQFEAKAKQFEKTLLKKHGKKAFSPLEVETLFWKACADKPFSVEYANDMLGSGFAPLGGGRGKWRDEEAANVGETVWNMRGVSRAKGSLLRFMKEEIAGVTSPMVYVAMMFSWFAWHMEDHELHSLNYLHIGAGKTWYGVPRDARLAFEDVIRNQGYGGEVNPLVTFTKLGEKTTIMSPEIIIRAGIPCCRLVQNVGEFVVTFPGSYHTGFSHGFNCGEAANIATPNWLRVAKEAAVRRASTNFPPMVSHFQLLYALALSLCSSTPVVSSTEPRSSRLKDKMRGEGESMVKSIFVQSVTQNNDLLNVLLKGSLCIILPKKASETLYSSSLTRSQVKMNPRVSHSLCGSQEALGVSETALSDDIILGRSSVRENSGGPSLSKRKSLSVPHRGSKFASAAYGRQETAELCSSTSDSQNLEGEKQRSMSVDGLLDQGLLSCVTCGILSFACVAVVQPSEEASRFLMSADFSFFSDDHNMGYGETSRADEQLMRVENYDLISCSGSMERHSQDGVDDNLVPGTCSVQVSKHKTKDVSFKVSSDGASALDLLASVYGNLSDSEDEDPHNIYSRPLDFDELGTQTSPYGFKKLNGAENITSKVNYIPTLEDSKWNRPESPLSHVVADQEFDSDGFPKESNGPYVNDESKTGKGLSGLANLPDHTINTVYDPNGLQDQVVLPGSDKDSSRMHVFCLEHAVEVVKKLNSIGGMHIMLLCHPYYPEIEAEAKVMAEELGIYYDWKDIPFKEASEDDEIRIHQAMEDEEAIPVNSDWAVKLGINLYYSANLSKSPIYSKQMPYNAVIYKAFGCKSPRSSPVRMKGSGRRPGRQKKLVVAGKWCGKVWMSNQVHPFLLQRQEPREYEYEEKLSPDNSGHNPVMMSESEMPDEVEDRSKVVRRNLVGSAEQRKSGKKRKRTTRNAGGKKLRSAQADNGFNEDGYGDADEKPSLQRGKVLQKRQHKLKNSKLHSMIDMKVKLSNMEVDEEGGPSTRLRKRAPKTGLSETKINKEKSQIKRKNKTKKARDQDALLEEYEDVVVQPARKLKKAREMENASVKEEVLKFPCDVDGCSMSFDTKSDLVVHKKNICPVKGCGKKFFSHKYLVQHKKVHLDDRPLKCPWKGCKMAFKWAWARTEHIRVHTGDRPYICREPGCGQTFRFVSDFSRHKRKTGHSAKKSRR